MLYARTDAGGVQPGVSIRDRLAAVREYKTDRPGEQGPGFRAPVTGVCFSRVFGYAPQRGDSGERFSKKQEIQ